ncbi:hypothetical protein, partial [uncultured Oscillibacter sp.]|uniref:hypothetical protein n=1 Tax=uncultured Oscillibacter sp. TaxID=876091 RepID=UPI0025ECB6D2
KIAGGILTYLRKFFLRNHLKYTLLYLNLPSGNDRIFMTAAAGGLAAICRCFACFDWTVCRSGLAFSRPPYYNTASEV